MKQSSGEAGREDAKVCLRTEMRVEQARRRPLLRHCERSEAIQNPSEERLWIASSQELLAMTAWRERALELRSCGPDVALRSQ